MLVHGAKEASCVMGRARTPGKTLGSMGAGVEGQMLGQQHSGFALRDPLGSTSGKLLLAFLF